MNHRSISFSVLFIASALQIFLASPSFSLISTVAGDGTAGFSGDGGATAVSLNRPQGVFVDPSGNILIGDTFNHRVRSVSPSGALTTIGGNGTTTGSLGDGGPALSAPLRGPIGVVDREGNIYIAVWGQHRIRKINQSTGIITTVAGIGVAGFSGEGGAATSAMLKYPSGVHVDSSGLLTIADTVNHRIRTVSTSGVIITVAGNGIAGFTGDGGAATGASLWNPWAVAYDASGHMYIADYTNHRIRKVTGP